MNEILKDIAFAWRNALRNPAISLLIVVTLALGIGLNGAVFSVTWRLLFAPLQYTDSEQLFLLQQQRPAAGRSNLRWSGLTVTDVGGMSTLLTDVASYETQDHTFTGRGDPWLGGVGVARWNFLSLLGLPVQLGRNFTSDDDLDGAEPVMLLSQEIWQRRFGADPAAVGATLEVAGVSYQVVGVLPSIPAWPDANDAWVTERSDPYRLFKLTGAYSSRKAQNMSHVIGRLRAGATAEQLAADLDALAQRLIATYPDDYAADYRLTAHPLDAELTSGSRATFLLLAGLAMLVVLIASANVASLNLARLAQRNQELAIREAVGAAPIRITRQLFSESVLFALGGGLLGLVMAWPALSLLSRFAGGYSALANGIRFDSTLISCVLATALLSATLSTLAPAFSRRDLNATLKEGGSKATMSSAGMRYRKVLMLVQFALAFAVLTSATLMMISLLRLERQDTGFNDERVLAVSTLLNIDFAAGDYETQMQSFGRQLLEQVEALPGVISAGLYTGMPMLQESTAYVAAFPLYIEGSEAADGDSNPLAAPRFVTADYFATLDIPLLQGRLLTNEDDADAALVAVVNESATRLFPGGNAIGGRVRLSPNDEWREIVGVVAEVRATHLDRVEGPVLYVSFWQWPAEGQNLYIKTTGDPRQLTAAVTDIVHRIDPDQSLQTVAPLTELKQQWLAPAKLRVVLITLSGLLALSVTLAGVVGVIGCNVSQRLQEVGIRMAVGAAPAGVTRLFVVDGLSLCAGGMLLGLVLMLALAPLLQPLLYGITAYDIGAYAGSTALLTLATLIASWLPARRAGGLNPVQALRAE